MGPIRRAIRNAVWLLGGKGVGGLFSLVYLALAARSLGVEAFGEFALILAYGQAVANIVGFQSWQTVIRYGAKHLLDKAPDHLQRILGFTALLDIGAAGAGATLAAAGVFVVGPLMGWSDHEQLLAALFGLSLMFGIRGTPTGVLRLFDRFDLAAYSETVLPAMRLVGAVTTWLLGASVVGFLLAWAVAELVTSLAMWTAAYRELRRHGAAGSRKFAVRGVVAENPGLWAFAWTTNLSTSMTLVWQQLPTLVLGSFTGPAVAGGYRVAFQLSAALSKPALSLSRAFFPELAKIAHAGGLQAILPILKRSTIGATIAGVATVLLLVLLGKPLISLIAGPDYVFAYPFLIALAVAGAIELCAFGVEPALLAMGHAGTPLKARIFAGIAYVFFMLLLLKVMGAIGVGIAAILASLTFVLLLSWFAWRMVGARNKAS